MRNAKQLYFTAFTSKALASFIVILSLFTVSIPFERASSQNTMRAIFPNSDSNTISIIDVEAGKATTPPDGIRGNSLFSEFSIACGQLAAEPILNFDAQEGIKRTQI